MKAPEVHKIMRQTFVPFVLELGFKREGKSSHFNFLRGSLYVRFSYTLSAGFNRWFGGELCLNGTANAGTRQAQHLIYYPRLSDSIISPTFRTRLRNLAIPKLEWICQSPEMSFLDLPHWVAPRERYEEFYRCYLQDELFVPPFMYFDEDDIRMWCRSVVAFLPDAIDRLISAAEIAPELSSGI